MTDFTALTSAGILEQRRTPSGAIVRVTSRFLATAEKVPLAPLAERIEAALRIWHTPLPEAAHELAAFLAERDQAGSLA